MDSFMLSFRLMGLSAPALEMGINYGKMFLVTVVQRIQMIKMEKKIKLRRISTPLH